MVGSLKMVFFQWLELLKAGYFYDAFSYLR